VRDGLTPGRLVSLEIQLPLFWILYSYSLVRRRHPL